MAETALDLGQVWESEADEDSNRPPSPATVNAYAIRNLGPDIVRQNKGSTGIMRDGKLTGGFHFNEIAALNYAVEHDIPLDEHTCIFTVGGYEYTKF